MTAPVPEPVYDAAVRFLATREPLPLPLWLAVGAVVGEPWVTDQDHAGACERVIELAVTNGVARVSRG